MTRPHVKELRQKLLEELKGYRTDPVYEDLSREDLIEVYHYYVYLKRSTFKVADALM